MITDILVLYKSINTKIEFMDRIKNMGYESCRPSFKDDSLVVFHEGQMTTYYLVGCRDDREMKLKTQGRRFQNILVLDVVNSETLKYALSRIRGIPRELQ